MSILPRGIQQRPRLRPLAASDLVRLSEAGHRCRLGPMLVPDAAWAAAAVAEWGMCGVAMVLDGRVVGYALVATPLHVPRTHPLNNGGVNADAAALVAVYVSEAQQRCGYGRQLVQSTAARLVGRRHITAIDAVGSASGVCGAPPSDWLMAVGFQPLTTDPTRYRLDLRGTRSWREDVAGVIQHVIGIVRPLPPEPATSGTQRSTRGATGG